MTPSIRRTAHAPSVLQQELAAAGCAGRLLSLGQAS